MPIKLSELKTKTRSLYLTYDGELFSVAYFPARFTPTFYAHLQDATGGANPLIAMATDLAEVLASWEIVDDKGKPLAPTAELLVKMPLDLLSDIANAITADMAPKKTNAVTSNGSLSPTE